MNDLRAKLPIEVRQRRWCGWAATALASLVLLAAAGCDAELDTTYGRTARRYLPTSVNGVDVLSAMFAQAGHEVTSRRVLLTSAMENVQTVVWFPDDFDAPSEETCEWFDDWLAGDARRTLVYVGRNFDAEAVYWRKMASRLGPHQREMFQRHKQALDEITHRAEHRSPKDLTCPWFTINPFKQNPATDVTGPWSRVIDPKKAEIETSDGFQPVGPARHFLADGPREIVWQRINPTKGQGRLIVVDNGSFLLNLPLVNHEHRKLAGKLIETVGKSGRVVFLESGPDGPTIDPPAGESSLAMLFGAWPLNVILLHFAVLGIIFCFARWPIFGRPRIPAAESSSDFGKHVDAVAALLERTRDRGYALGQLSERLDAASGEPAGNG